MTIDLTPVPRLPLDEAQVDVFAVGTAPLDVVVVSMPDTGLAQVSLLETPTPLAWASSAYSEIYHKPVTGLFIDPTAAANECVPIIARWENNLAPPQGPGP